jgi:DHA2 family multidrug resistance protein
MAPADLGRNKWVVAAVITLGVFITVLDTTIVDIVLPKMMPELETDIYGIQWVVIIYFVGAAVSMTVVAWLAERIGHRNCYLAGVAGFVTMSALCGAARSLEAMVTARFLQGIAEGLVVPVGLLILYDVFPTEERGLAMGIFVLGGTFAPTIGPSLGGYITEHTNWRFVFYVNVPVGVLDILLVSWILANRRAAPPEHHDPPPGGRARRHRAPSQHLDLVGVSLLSSGLSLLVVVLAKGQEKGWMESDLILGLTLGCFLAFAAFVAWEVFAADPLIPRSLFHRREVAVSLAAHVPYAAGCYGVLILLPLYLERLRGQTALQAGLLLLPGSLLAAVGTLVGGILADRLRPKWVGIVTMTATALAMWTFRMTLETPLAGVENDYLLWGLVGNMGAAPLALLMFAAIRDEDLPHATMIINVARLISGALGTAYITNVLTSRSNAFYDSLASRIEWSAHAGRELVATLGVMTGAADTPLYNPDLVHGARFVGRGLLQAIAVGEAFGASMKHLGLMSAAAALIVLWARNIKGKSAGVGH